MLDNLRQHIGWNAQTLIPLVIVAALSVTAVSSLFGGFASNSGSYAAQEMRTTASANGMALDTSIAPPRVDTGTDDSTERKRIVRVYMSFEVPDVASAISHSKQLAENYGGYSESESFNRYNGDQGSVSVRVPKNNLSEYLTELEASDWELKNKNQNTQDVTDRYTELSLELDNKRQEMQQLQRLMNQTDEVESLIKIQERMSEIRSRVQYLENQIEDIDKQVEYTQVNINFEEPQPITSEFEIRESLRKAYRGIFDSINFIIVSIGYLIPFSLIAGIGYFVHRRRRGKAEE